MNKTELYELAQATGKALVAEKDSIAIALAVANAAKANNVNTADFAQFQQYVNQTVATYRSLSMQKLPSEILAAQAARVESSKPKPEVAAEVKAE